MVGWPRLGFLEAGRRHGLEERCASDEPCRPVMGTANSNRTFRLACQAVSIRETTPAPPALVSGIEQPPELAASMGHVLERAIAVVLVCPEFLAKRSRRVAPCVTWKQVLCSAEGLRRALYELLCFAWRRARA
jgi:hypothetical protein